MKRKAISILVFCFIGLFLFSCGRKEVVVDKPNGNIIESSTIESSDDKKQIEETTVVNTIQEEIDFSNMTLEEKEELFEKYLGLLGGQEPLEYRQYLYEIKENGKYNKFVYDSNGEMSTQNVITTEEEFIKDIIQMIKEKNPDIEQREGEDWEYVASMLNLGDFGSYESAFIDCDCGFWGNALSAGVFNDENEKKYAYDKFMECKNMKEKADYLRKLVGEKQDNISDNKPIIEAYVDNMKDLIFGNDADKIEIKELGITSISDRDIRFNYILGEKITPDTKQFYYIEDSVKGYIEDGTFVRDNNPVWTDEELGLEPESIKEGMIVQYSEKDADLLNHATQIEDYDNGERFGCEDSKLLYSKNAEYILDVADLFPNMNKDKIKSKISNNLPVCRKLIMIE